MARKRRNRSSSLTELLGRNYKTLRFMIWRLGFGANQAVDAQELAAIFRVILVISGPAQPSVNLLRLVTALGGFASLQFRWKFGRVRCLVRAVSLFGQHR